jgi:MATE family multidrug resistance protein
VSPLRAEVRKMLALGLPVAGTQVSTMLLGVVDAVMVGHVSVEAMAAASLANVWIWATFLFAQGALMGLDPIVAQAHGARDGERAGRALHAGFAVALGLSAALAVLWLFTERVLLLTGQDPELARGAHAYTLVQIPSIPFFLVYSALRQYLQGREYVRPALFVIAAANVLNVLFAWALIFGHLGLPPLGLVGAGIAACLTRVASGVGLVALVAGFGLHRGAWVPVSRGSLRARELRELAAYGLPVAIQVSLEAWAFSGAALLVGHLGAEALAAHTIALNLASLSFMMPLGIAQGAATRVGNLLGAREPAAAQRAAWVSLGLGAGVMSLSAVAFVALREGLPRLYTPDAAVGAACAAIMPIAAAFQIFDGTQVVGCGILRGMGRVRPATAFNLIGYWLLGLPLGGWLALRGGFGLAGLWWGLALGLAVVACSLVTFVALRGPGCHPLGDMKGAVPVAGASAEKPRSLGREGGPAA